MPADRCKVWKLDLEDLDRAVDDPAFNLLLSTGWTVIANVAVDEGGREARPHLRVVLRPPAATAHDRTSPSLAIVVAVAAPAGVASFAGIVLGMMFLGMIS